MRATVPFITVTLMALLFSLAANAGTVTTQTALSQDQGAGESKSLTPVNGVLYGVRMDGGALGFGGLFKLDHATGREKILYSFDCYNDRTALPLIVGGNALYSATYTPNGQGKIVKYDIAAGTWSTVHAFTGAADGNNADEIRFIDGAIYVGADNGAIFSLDPASGAMRPLHTAPCCRNQDSIEQ